MGFTLTEYVKIKDNYCICYFGHETSYLVQLRILRPYIERLFPQLRMYLCCNDNYLYLFEDEPRVLPRSQITLRKRDFAFVTELTADHKHHIIEKLLKESNIDIPKLPQRDKDGVCLILPEGVPPVRCAPIDVLKKHAKSLGLAPVVIGSDVHFSLQEIKSRPTGEDRILLAKNAKVAIGVECDLLYLTGFYGGRTVLAATGSGLEFYKRLFPDGELTK